MTAPRVRLVGALAVAMVVAGACSSTTDTSTVAPTAPQTSATTSGPTTAPPTSGPATTAPAPPLTAQEAFQVVSSFDPGTGDPAVLADALAVTGPAASLRLPHFIENGSPEVRTVVFDSLRSGSPWGVTTLVAMEEFGMPSGTYLAPRIWPSEQAFEISNAIEEGSAVAFGALKEMMVDLNRHFLHFEVELCIRESCEWGGGWYAVPGALANPVGEVDDRLFAGTVVVVSDTGAGDEMPIKLREFHGWEPVDGYLADPPAFGIYEDQSRLFEGAVVAEPTITIAGWAESGTMIHSGGASTVASDGWWELEIEVPVDGAIEIIGEAMDGPARAEMLHVAYMPTLDETFGYITGVGQTADGEPALEVDYAEWLSGEAATIAAREDGEIGPDEFIDNDYYIRNRNPQLRTIPLDPYTPVRLISTVRGPLVEVTVPLEDFLGMLASGDDNGWYGAASDYTPFWFMVDGDSKIYQIRQQYVP